MSAIITAYLRTYQRRHRRDTLETTLTTGIRSCKDSRKSTMASYSKERLRGTKKTYSGKGMVKVGRLLSISPVRYWPSFRAFLAAVEMGGGARGDNNLYQTFGSKVPDTFLHEAESELRVLGIGSGSGEADSIILKKLLQRHKRVYNRVVEPSGEMIERFKTLVREDTGLRGVTFDWRHQTDEEYFRKKINTQFHLLHAVHVLYCVEDLHATLRNMWEQLEDTGYMFIILEADKGNVWKMREKFWERFGQGDRLKSSLRTTGDVKQWLDTMGISYVTSEYEINIDVTECFKENSEAGRQLLDFLTQTPYITNDPEMQTMVLENIRCNASVVGEKILLKQIGEAVIAFKKGAEKN
ncbi:HNMT [Branchiostoma lanceolatum]|uniref:HNMT protein n=1 Tax=Branchiostoma lanceolatum TaxID=7740 RepID=A0A8J9ZXU5_BRALA|nr:HNMT [Branchiostoma lanceolatum]